MFFLMKFSWIVTFMRSEIFVYFIHCQYNKVDFHKHEISEDADHSMYLHFISVVAKRLGLLHQIQESLQFYTLLHIKNKKNIWGFCLDLISSNKSACVSWSTAWSVPRSYSVLGKQVVWHQQKENIRMHEIRLKTRSSGTVWKH